MSLMMVEKVPDSTYEMVGGLDKQIKEIKEVIATILADENDLMIHCWSPGHRAPSETSGAV